MKITFIGLSCFLFENEQGDRLLIDPYYDTPELALGLQLPKDLKADVFLVSHPDEDHSYLRHSMMREPRAAHIQDQSASIDVFPQLNIRGVLVKEYNGALNIAYSFTIDGIRILHLADNAHLLNKQQLEDIGNVDIVFISPPKAHDPTFHIENVKQLHPHIIIPSHFIPPKVESIQPSESEVEAYLKMKVLQPWIKNPAANENTVKVFTHMFFGALAFKEQFSKSKDIFSPTVVISKADFLDEPRAFIFRICLGT